MTVTDPTLDRWQRSERRRAVVIGCLVGAVLLLVVSVVALSQSLAVNSRADEERVCAAGNVARGEIRVAIIEAIVVLFDELATNPQRFAPTIGKVRDRLEETLPDRVC